MNETRPKKTLYVIINKFLKKAMLDLKVYELILIDRKSSTFSVRLRPGFVSVWLSTLLFLFSLCKVYCVYMSIYVLNPYKYV